MERSPTSGCKKFGKKSTVQSITTSRWIGRNIITGEVRAERSEVHLLGLAGGPGMNWCFCSWGPGYRGYSSLHFLSSACGLEASAVLLWGTFPVSMECAWVAVSLYQANILPTSQSFGYTSNIKIETELLHGMTFGAGSQVRVNEL